MRAALKRNRVVFDVQSGTLKLGRELLWQLMMHLEDCGRTAFGHDEYTAARNSTRNPPAVRDSGRGMTSTRHEKRVVP
jgi:hypothetical protein